MADSTDSLFTRDLMFVAVPYSSASILPTRAICCRVAPKKRKKKDEMDGVTKQGCALPGDVLEPRRTYRKRYSLRTRRADKQRII